MLRYLVTDLDGVIRHFPKDRDREIETAFGIQPGLIPHCAFGFSDLSEVITGAITDAQWRSNIVDRLAEHIEDESANLAIKEWSDFSGCVDEDVLAFYRSKNLPIILLSNATDRLTSDLERLNISKEFTHIFNSSEIGFSKPSDDIFRHVFTTLDCKANELVFIDDSLDNVLSAKKLGFITHHFTGMNALTRFWKTDEI